MFKSLKNFFKRKSKTDITITYNIKYKLTKYVNTNNLNSKPFVITILGKKLHKYSHQKTKNTFISVDKFIHLGGFMLDLSDSKTLTRMIHETFGKHDFHELKTSDLYKISEQINRHIETNTVIDNVMIIIKMNDKSYGFYLELYHQFYTESNSHYN